MFFLRAALLLKSDSATFLLCAIIKQHSMLFQMALCYFALRHLLDATLFKCWTNPKGFIDAAVAAAVAECDGMAFPFDDT